MGLFADRPRTRGARDGGGPAHVVITMTAKPTMVTKKLKSSSHRERRGLRDHRGEVVPLCLVARYTRRSNLPGHGPTHVAITMTAKLTMFTKKLKVIPS